MATKVFFGNYKGGVGKTTSTFQIAGWMAKLGKRILMIDLDPQSSLSHICAQNVNDGPSLEEYPYNNTLNYAIELYMRYIKNNVDDYQLLTNKVDNLKTFIKDIVFPVKENYYNSRLQFIPSSIVFRNARLNDLAQRMSKNVLNIFIVPLVLKHLDCDKKFDYIFFDCPPTSNILTQSVFMVSDYYIIPTIGDEISVHGVPDYIMEIESNYTKYTMNDEVGGILLNAYFNEKPQLLGVFETIYKQNSNNLNVIETLDKNIDQLNITSILSNNKYKDYRYTIDKNGTETKHIFSDFIPHRSGVTTGTSMSLHMKNGDLHEAYRDISEKILDILNNV